jgi:hypothetical protein
MRRGKPYALPFGESACLQRRPEERGSVRREAVRGAARGHETGRRTFREARSARRDAGETGRTMGGGADADARKAVKRAP